MAMILPEIVLQRVLQQGIKDLRANPNAFKEIFDQMLDPEMVDNYGQTAIDGIRSWFMATKFPVVQAFAFDPTKLPSVSIHLGVENEDESKAAMNDLAGLGDEGEILVGVDQVVLDIGVHADRAKDDVLWLYYIIKYILYKQKHLARKLGLQLHTFSVSEYNKQGQYQTENVWTRWVRFRCTVQNYLDGEQYSPDVTDTEVDVNVQPIHSVGDDDVVNLRELEDERYEDLEDPNYIPPDFPEDADI